MSIPVVLMWKPWPHPQLLEALSLQKTLHVVAFLGYLYSLQWRICVVLSNRDTWGNIIYLTTTFSDNKGCLKFFANGPKTIKFEGCFLGGQVAKSSNGLKVFSGCIRCSWTLNSISLFSKQLENLLFSEKIMSGQSSANCPLLSACTVIQQYFFHMCGIQSSSESKWIIVYCQFSDSLCIPLNSLLTVINLYNFNSVLPVKWWSITSLIWRQSVWKSVVIGVKVNCALPV